MKAEEPSEGAWPSVREVNRTVAKTRSQRPEPGETKVSPKWPEALLSSLLILEGAPVSSMSLRLPMSRTEAFVAPVSVEER